MPCSMLLFSVDTAQKYGENMYLISKRCIHVLVCTRPSLYHSNLRHFSKDVKLSKISCFNWNSYLVCLYKYGNMGCWVFKGKDTKLERFLHKNQHTQRKLLNFENWVNGEVSKSAKIWLSKSIFYVENYPNISQFFFDWRISI